MKLYDHFEEAFFVERDNRFVMQLRKKDGQLIKAYVANPGRMEEFQVINHPFFITSGNSGKYDYRVVATEYQGSYILLDTIKINSIVDHMLKNDMIPAFRGSKTIRREYSVNRSKFDFLIERENQPPTLLEVKSCSLCHNGIAMFPDAPTTRGKRHLEDLQELNDRNYDCYTLYLINHKYATSFMPNWHTDMEYTIQFLQSDKVNFMAYSIQMTDPVTINPHVLQPIQIDFEQIKENCLDKGSYMLVFYNEKTFKKTIGALGERAFKKGYYVYVGSAMQGLEKRIKRHLSKRKKIRWHLDYISPGCMKVDKIFRINRKERLEALLAKQMTLISPDYIAGFGASDSDAPSHLFYFPDRPYRRREFLDLLLDLRMGKSKG
jgi:sugar fermentation stimulation protein A